MAYLRKGARALAVITAMLAFAACGRETGGQTGAPAARSEAGAAAPKRYFVAAANRHAVEAGAMALERGGSAVDAAIAVQAVLGLVEPQSSGLGGGAFMLHYDPAAGTLETYDGREVAPASARPDRFLTPEGEPMNFLDAVVGGLSVGVPGVVRMLELAHEEHGVLPWAELFEPAARLAEEGFAVSPRLHGLIARIPRLKQMPAAAEYFYTEDGAPLPVGHVLKNPAYARTLRLIAEGGADAFYEGEIAAAIVEAVNSAPNPGGMTLEDLRDYRPVKREAVCGPYRGYEICSMAPPSSGGVTLLQILALLEPFDMKGAGADSIEAIHLLFEASRLAYADRNMYLGDLDHAAGDLAPEAVIAGLLNPAYLAARAALISRARAMESVGAGDPSVYAIDGEAAPGRWSGFAPDASPEPPSTSHFVIVDGEGRVVSMTTTVEFAFGSHLMAAGMVLNNQLTDFSFLPERDGVPVANAVAPGKRPRSSMTPAIVFDGEGEVWAALGSPGGPAIIGYVAKTLIGLIDWGLSMQAAIDAPHAVYPRGAPILEAGGFDAQIVAGLRRLGHDVSERELTSGLHGFRRLPDGTFDGGADKRREGTWKTGFVAE
ncbi:gamma-glutamyltransferase [Amphiplicatus metriothermophilus]|uniref:Glutathione hydrolase proenzyme n=1 Tax=Amphiplicatus metriothermophilus TaxID=1519374 RepID=A0A239PIH8_9PROT|nr:gamma-glutamyltransferase [Amphiplicatus metriothermophilus]MBB5518055.1 gamma-glutamyltranspeptidase/glutathione hydrolase [Amphiplicatus metriothermophilus]SNT67611.1 gamma-glutamyltransferase 1 Threonine peptidase. MEROPS family T03 [Amphiplicatus metriothermophilus]